MSKEFSMQVHEFIGVLKENDKHDWCKAVARIQWGDNPTTLDIRNINLSVNRAGKGISLTDEEVDKLVEILLDNDYGTIEALTKALERKKSRFEVKGDEPKKNRVPIPETKVLHDVSITIRGM